MNRPTEEPGPNASVTAEGICQSDAASTNRAAARGAFRPTAGLWEGPDPLALHAVRFWAGRSGAAAVGPLIYAATNITD